MIDLEPAATRMATLLAGVTDDQLRAPTPCPDYRLEDLIAHVSGLSQAFTAAAAKDLGEMTSTSPTDALPTLDPDWRDRAPEYLTALAAAWRAPDAWEGMTQAGGVDLPGEVAGLVVLDELVVHGWDIARASGQQYEVDAPSLEGTLAFVSTFETPEDDDGGLFGPAVAVPDDAPLLDRVIGLTGRDPSWKP